MLEYKIQRVQKGITVITDPTGVHCYLAEGENRTLLIDTCTGFRGLESLVHTLTDKPFEVVLTHGHVDHAGGAAAFESIWLHPADMALFNVHHTSEERMGYARACLPEGIAVTQQELVDQRTPKILPLSSGQLFPLGGMTIEAIHVPGHTKGMTCILFHEERMMLFGDAANPNTLVVGEFSTSIAEYEASLRSFARYDHLYDTVLSSHGPVLGERSCLQDNIDLCGRIIAGTDDKEEMLFMGEPVYRGARADEWYHRLDGKVGNIVYSPHHR